MKLLDRNRYYALCYGDSDKKYYQDGIFFNGRGEPISSPERAKPPAPEPEVESPVDDTGNEPPVVVELKPKQQDDALMSRLQAMHVSKLKKLAVKVSEAEGTAEACPELKGSGLKKRLIAYIAANTT